MTYVTELTMRILPLNFTSEDLDEIQEMMKPIAAKVTEIENRESGAQLARLKASRYIGYIDPAAPAACLEPTV